MNFPEIEVYNYIKGIVSVLKDDLKNNPENSFIEDFFGDSKVGKYAFAKEIKSLFLRPETSDSYLDVRMFFDARRANIPTIHVTLPYEKGGDSADGIGTDEGYEGNDETPNGSYRKLTRGFSTSYSIVVSTSNTLETIGIYRVLQAALIQYIENMEVDGFMNLKISGGDLQLNPDIVPNGVFLRSINIDFSYKTTVRKILPDKYLREIIAKGSVGDVMVATSSVKL